MKRYFAIGDVHGCLNKLMELMDKIHLNPDDELIFLGDYIDRGPNSRGVIDFLINLTGNFKKIFLKGNHEDMMLKALSLDATYDRINHWVYNGGLKTIQNYGSTVENINIPKEHMDFLNNLSLFYETDDYIFVHAGFNPNIPASNHEEDYFLWVRNEFIQDQTKWPKLVIHGHTPRDNPLVMNNKIGIDTGCFYTGHLTCVELPSIKFYRTNN